MTDTPGRATRAEARERLALLESYLAHDPANAPLRLDAAAAALDAGEVDRAAAILARPAPIDSPRARNLAGLAAMRLGRWEDAAAAFAALVEGGENDPAVRFNLAWTRALLKDVGGAMEMLTPDVTERLAVAAMLEVQLLHQQAALDEAVERGLGHLARFPDDPGLNAAMSVLAIDAERPDLAAACAERAGDHPDALTSRATLALDAEDPAAARPLFDRVLAHDPDNARAHVGRGLARLMTGEAGDAPADLDRGAALFATHQGSWIAAGWAHVIAGDTATARARFEQAMALDATFAESHGGLAVIDALEGQTQAAGERVRVAVRLDRECYGAALARVLLAASAGDEETAGAILQRALSTPLDDGGRTIGQMLAKMGSG